MDKTKLAEIFLEKLKWNSSKILNKYYEIWKDSNMKRFLLKDSNADVKIIQSNKYVKTKKKS